MPVKNEALIEPDLLVWARESSKRALDESAKKIGVTPERLREWETGKSRPSVSKLRKAAKAYKRPLAVFYLSERPADYDVLRLPDYRRVFGEPEVPLSPELAQLLITIDLKRELARELLEGEESRVKEILGVATITDNVDALAARMRNLLEVSIEEQFSWNSPYDGLKAWSTAIEAFGVLVFQNSTVPIEEMRGFSINDPMVPVIVLNSKDSPRGRIFTLVHEFAHLLLNQGGICDPYRFAEAGSYGEPLEIFANSFAGDLLVPANALRKIEIIPKRSTIQTWQNDELQALGNAFSVSKEVVLRRLLTLGYTDRKFYLAKRRELIQSYKEAATRPRKNIPFPPFRQAIRDNGRTFTGLVLEAYYEDRLAAGDVSEYLGFRLKHLQKVEAALSGSSA